MLYYKWIFIFKKGKNEFIELPKLNCMGISSKIALMKVEKKYMHNIAILFINFRCNPYLWWFNIIYIGIYMVVRFEFESYWLSGRLSSIWIGGYMILIGVSNVVAIKIALRRSLVITSLIANILGLEIASFGGVIHIKLLWWENIYCAWWL